MGKAAALPTITAAPKKVEPQITEAVPKEIEFNIDLTAYPYYPETGYRARRLNVSTRLTERQSKAMRALTAMHVNQTRALQHILDLVADAIEDQCNVTL